MSGAHITFSKSLVNKVNNFHKYVLNILWRMVKYAIVQNILQGYVENYISYPEESESRFARLCNIINYAIFDEILCENITCVIQNVEDIQNSVYERCRVVIDIRVAWIIHTSIFIENLMRKMINSIRFQTISRWFLVSDNWYLLLVTYNWFFFAHL